MKLEKYLKLKYFLIVLIFSLGNYLIFSSSGQNLMESFNETDLDEISPTEENALSEMEKSKDLEKQEQASVGLPPIISGDESNTVNILSRQSEPIRSCLEKAFQSITKNQIISEQNIIPFLKTSIRCGIFGITLNPDFLDSSWTLRPKIDSAFFKMTNTPYKHNEVRRLSDNRQSLKFPIVISPAHLSFYFSKLFIDLLKNPPSRINDPILFAVHQHLIRDSHFEYFKEIFPIQNKEEYIKVLIFLLEKKIFLKTSLEQDIQRVRFQFNIPSAYIEKITWQDRAENLFIFLQSIPMNSGLIEFFPKAKAIKLNEARIEFRAIINYAKLNERLEDYRFDFQKHGKVFSEKNRFLERMNARSFARFLWLNSNGFKSTFLNNKDTWEALFLYFKPYIIERKGNLTVTLKLVGNKMLGTQLFNAFYASLQDLSMDQLQNQIYFFKIKDFVSNQNSIRIFMKRKFDKNNVLSMIESNENMPNHIFFIPKYYNAAFKKTYSVFFLPVNESIRQFDFNDRMNLKIFNRFLTLMPTLIQKNLSEYLNNFFALPWLTIENDSDIEKDLDDKKTIAGDIKSIKPLLTIPGEVLFSKALKQYFIKIPVKRIR